MLYSWTVSTIVFYCSQSHSLPQATSVIVWLSNASFTWNFQHARSLTYDLDSYKQFQTTITLWLEKQCTSLWNLAFIFTTLYSTVCDEPFREKENKISTPLQLVLQSKLIIQPISASHLLQPCISFNRTLEVESTATRNLPSGEPRYNNYSASFSLCHAESF